MLSVTEAQIHAIIANSKVEDQKMGEKTTIVCVTLPNGFVIVQSSSCVKPIMYNHELGVKICMKRIEDKIWELEGYLFQEFEASLDDNKRLEDNMMKKYGPEVYEAYLKQAGRKE